MFSDLCIVRYKNGITLVEPELCILSAANRVLLSDINKFNLDIYFYNTNSTFHIVNESTAESCGFDSPAQAAGSTLYQTSSNKYAEQLVRNNEFILNNNARSFLSEEIKCSDETYHRGVSFKMPWYTNGNITGIFGCTIVEGKHELVDSLNQILELGFLEKNHNLSNIIQTRIFNGIKLTLRESEILSLIAKGRTARQIAESIKLSRRTVENYISNVRQKAGVKSKSELIALYCEQVQ